MTERELLAAYGMDPDDLSRPLGGPHPTDERRPTMSRGALSAIPTRRYDDDGAVPAPGYDDSPGHPSPGTMPPTDGRRPSAVGGLS